MRTAKDCENANFGGEYATIHTRYREICRVFFGNSTKDMAKALDLEYSNLASHLSGQRNYPKYHIKVLEVLPQINAQWFLFGKGEMLAEQTKPIASQSSDFLTLLTEYNKLRDEIAGLREKLAMYEGREKLHA